MLPPFEDGVSCHMLQLLHMNHTESRQRPKKQEPASARPANRPHHYPSRQEGLFNLSPPVLSNLNKMRQEPLRAGSWPVDSFDSAVPTVWSRQARPCWVEQCPAHPQIESLCGLPNMQFGYSAGIVSNGTCRIIMVDLKIVG